MSITNPTITGSDNESDKESDIYCDTTCSNSEEEDNNDNGTADT